MELSNQDTLRLNVLLANKPWAIRIDESRMIVYGLLQKGEVKVQLNPVGREDLYVRKVRELLSGHIMGSPGGYPVYLRRWTRMGQMRDESLEQLLMLGEPEAVVAAVCSPGLSDELAHRAWWAMEDAENARLMLANPRVVEGEMGKILAKYLVDYLPFETEPEKMIESVRSILQPGLLEDRVKRDLWAKSARKQVYLVGFLAATPDDLPDPERSAARTHAVATAYPLQNLAEAGNPCASLLIKVLLPAGQIFLKTLETVLRKPSTQEVLVTVFDVTRRYFQAFRPEGDPDQVLEELIADARAICHSEPGPEDLCACVALAPQLQPELKAIRILSGLGYGVLRPLIRGSSATGSLLRRKLETVITPIVGQIGILRGSRP